MDLSWQVKLICTAETDSPDSLMRTQVGAVERGGRDLDAGQLELVQAMQVHRPTA